MNIKSIMFLNFLLLASCGGGSGGGYGGGNSNQNSPQQQVSKSIFSRWTRSDNITFDFSGGYFDSPYDFTVTLANQISCRCTAVISGTESAGTIHSSACRDANNGPDRSVCSQLDTPSPSTPERYTKNGNTLTICDVQCGALN